MSSDSTTVDALNQRLADSGLRSTPQREMVYQVLLERRDHPTADELFARVKGKLPTISLATVYNCLDALVQRGLVRQVNYERESSRYCCNLREHAHFFDSKTGRIIDVDLPPEYVDHLKNILPPGFVVHGIELGFRGTAPAPAETTVNPAN
jgi:Fur family transcriptional regulator, peroxide stress response regulator